MTPQRPGIRRLFQLDAWRGRDELRDMREEMEVHIALRAEQLEREGMPAALAREEARRLFAIHDTTITDLHTAALDRNRHMRIREYMEAAWQDTRYAARRLTRERTITLFILCTLALGIGINVTAFSVVDRVLLRGPQFVRQPDRLIRLYSKVNNASLGAQTLPWLPYTIFTALQTDMRSVDGLGTYRMNDAMVGSGAASEMRRVSAVSTNLFDLLGIRPARGRFFAPDDDDTRVVVLAERYWRSALGGDSAVLGTSVAINDVPHIVVGIAPAGFTGVELERVDAWTPVSRQSREHQNMEIVARLRPGGTVDAALAEIAVLRPRLESTLPRWASWLKGARYLAAPIAYDTNARESLEIVMARWLAAISAMILLISCANVANVLLARLARRRQELAVRMALGSGRARVVRLLALEGFLLAIGAALLAFVVITLLEPVVQRGLFPAGGWVFSLVDGRILSAVALCTLVTALLVAAVPAVQAGRATLGDALRGGNRGGESRSWLRPGLTIVQAMLSVVLLIGAGLFLRSLQRVNAVQLGTDPEHVLRVELRYPATARLPDETPQAFFAREAEVDRTRHRTLVDVVRAVPGVERAAVSVSVPFNGGVTQPLWIPGRDSVPALPGGGPWAAAVGADYFATIGTPIRKGRPFNAGDREGSEPVLVVSETMARELWPGRDAVGECVFIAKRTAPCARVVGVAADVHRSGLKEEPSMQFYVPMGQESGFAGSFLLVRPRDGVSGSWTALREALQRADPSIRSIDVRVLAQGLDGELRPFKLGMAAFGLSAAIALLVAGLGLYSIMAHAVAWRRHEIGVRMALGARPRAIAGLIVSRGATLATVGIAGGLLVALAARRWVEPRLFETSATDPAVLVGVVVVLEAVALLAAWVPVLRAVAVNPTEALRAE